MTGRHSLFPAAASPSYTTVLLPLLLVALYCCVPAAPASAVVRQGQDDAAGLAGVISSPDGVWLLEGIPRPAETGDSNIPQDSGARTSAADGAVIGDYGGKLQQGKYLHKREYPTTRRKTHRSRRSVDADGSESENGERSSSSFFVSSDWGGGARFPGREGERDFRPGNWPQEAGELKRVSSGDESDRKTFGSQHKSSIMAETREEDQLAGKEDHLRLRREMVEGEWGESSGASILASTSHDSHSPPTRKVAHGNDNPMAPLEELLAAIGAVEPDDDDTFNGELGNFGNLEHSLPSINPAVFPLRENAYVPGRGTMSQEPPKDYGDSPDSWGALHDLGSQQTRLQEEAFMDRSKRHFGEDRDRDDVLATGLPDEGMVREGPSLPHWSDLM